MSVRQSIARWRYVYGWRLRYWWLDTGAGARARIAAFCVAVLVVVADVARMAALAVMPAPPEQPQDAAIAAWVVYLIIMVVAGLVAYATAPRPKDAAPTQADVPRVDDGQTVYKAFGTIWIDDSFLLAWQVVGRTPIKASGGK